MKRSQHFRLEGLAKILHYALGVRPDEFCLVPDKDGFVPLKELLLALHEEPETTYVRESHIREVLYGWHGKGFEVKGSCLRAVERRWDFSVGPVEALPKIIFTPIRRKAHPVVAQRGLAAPRGRHIILSDSRDVALRIGKRRDSDPVILEIVTHTGIKEGLTRFGDLILCLQIPPKYIATPVHPDEADDIRSRKEGKKASAARKEPEAGSFFLDLSRGPEARRWSSGKKERRWKEKARRFRREKDWQ